MSYGGFMRQGVKFEMAFDNDPSKIGTTWNNIAIHHVDNLERYLDRTGADIAILSVPADAAQDLVDRLVKCGVAGILNFVPKRLIVPPGGKGALCGLGY